MTFLPARTDRRTIAILLPVVVFPFAIYFERPTITTALLLLYIILLLLLLLEILIFLTRGHSVRHYYVVIGSTTLLR